MGLFSRKKKSQGNIHMRGFPGHVDTCKCLYMAAEKGVKIDPDLLDLTGHEEEDSAFRALSPFGKIPCLGEGDLVTSGVAAILPYLDIRGSGQSLTPRKAARLGQQNYWIEVGQYRVLPHVNTLLDEEVLKTMSDSNHTPDQSAVGAALEAMEQVFTIADQFLDNRKYFAEDFSFADVHWAPYLHFCEITGHGDLIGKYPNMKQWFGRIKSRKNGSMNTYEALPSLDQIKGKELKNVA